MGEAVAFVLPIPLSIAFGGRELQALATVNALRGLGIKAEMLDHRATEASYDVLHVFGTEGSNWEIAARAQARGTRIVVSPVLSLRRSDLRYRLWKHFDPFVPLRTSFRFRRDLLRLSDRLVALTNTEKRVLMSVYGADGARIRVIPNGVSSVFTAADPNIFRATYGDSRFLLCVGGIEPLKGQLIVLDAAQRVNRPIVFIGQSRGDEYGRRFSEAIHEASNAVWIQGLPSSSPLLASAYAAADALVAASESEGMPLVALEAIAAGCPVVLPDLPQLIEVFAPFGRFYRQGSRTALARVLAADIPRLDQAEGRHAVVWSWEQVAESLSEVYEGLRRRP